jgi:hypothetical protein
VYQKPRHLAIGVTFCPRRCLKGVGQPHDKNPLCLLSVTSRGSLARLTAVDNRGSAECLRSSPAEAAGLLGWRMGELGPDKERVKSDTVRTTLSAFWTVASCRRLLQSGLDPVARNQCLHFRHQCGQVETDLGGQRRGLSRFCGRVQRRPDDPRTRSHW